MKLKLLFVLVTIAATFSIMSCKTSDASIVGTWVGKYDDQSGDGSLNGKICLEIKDKNELIVHDKTDKPNAIETNLGKGTWVVEGKTFKATYKYFSNPEDTTTHHNEGKISDDFKKIDGTKRQAGDKFFGGFMLEKQ